MNSEQYEDMSAIQGNKSAVANLFVQSSGNLYGISKEVAKKEEKEAEDFTYTFYSSVLILISGSSL